MKTKKKHTLSLFQHYVCVLEYVQKYKQFHNRFKIEKNV